MIPVAPRLLAAA